MSNPSGQILRLQAAITAVCPIISVSIGVPGNSATVSVVFDPASTGPQQAAAQTAITNFDWSPAAQATFDTQQARATADAALASIGGNAMLFRAVAAVLVDELNILRDLFTAQSAAVAAATTLADLKTRWAALAATPDRTLVQARNAIQAKIDAGTVDT